MHVRVIPDEGERVRRNEISEKLSDITYLKKDPDVDTSEYNILLNSLKNLDASYNPTMHKMHKPVIDGNCKVT